MALVACPGPTLRCVSDIKDGNTGPAPSPRSTKPITAEYGAVDAHTSPAPITTSSSAPRTQVASEERSTPSPKSTRPTVSPVQNKLTPSPARSIDSPRVSVNTEYAQTPATASGPV